MKKSSCLNNSGVLRRVFEGKHITNDKHRVAVWCWSRYSRGLVDRSFVKYFLILLGRTQSNLILEVHHNNLDYESLSRKYVSEFTCFHVISTPQNCTSLMFRQNDVNGFVHKFIALHPRTAWLIKYLLVTLTASADFPCSTPVSTPQCSYPIPGPCLHRLNYQNSEIHQKTAVIHMVGNELKIDFSKIWSTAISIPISMRIWDIWIIFVSLGIVL